MPAATRRKTPRSDAIARVRAPLAAICDVVEPWEHGTAYRATAFPRWWNVNSLFLEGPVSSGLTAQALAAEADRRQGDLDHRRVVIEHEATGAEVAAGLDALGWSVEPLVWMRRDATAPPAADPPAVTELSQDAADDLEIEWLLEDQVMPDEASIRAFIAERERGERRLPGRLAILGRPGTAFVTLRLDDAGGEIEAAYVTAAARGTGLGTGLLHAAIARADAAGVGDLWIVAVANGRPRHLYERLGFRAAWTYWDCVRRPPAKSDAPRR